MMMHGEFRTLLGPVAAEPVGIYQPAIDDAPLPAVSGLSDPVTHFEVERRIYGYLIRKIEHLPLRVTFAQGVAWVAALVVGEQGVAILTASRAIEAVTWGTACSAIGAFLTAWLFCHIATRGYLSHVEVDLRRGALREVMRHRTGSASLLREIPFKDVASLRTVPRAARRPDGVAGADDWILLCEVAGGETPYLMEVASGPAERVGALEALLRAHLRAVPDEAHRPLDPVADLVLAQCGAHLS